MLRLGTMIAAVFAAAFAQGARTDDAAARYVFTAAPQYEPAAWTRGQERFPKGAALILVSGAGRQKIAPGFYASADAAVSFDGTRLLFAGRPAAASRWQIFEVGIGGGAPRLVSAGDRDCVRPLYLPDGRIVYTSLSGERSDLEVATGDGKKAQRLNFVPGWYWADDVLHDGRILFENQGELFTVYPDGTGVESLRCDHGPRRADARQLSTGDVVFTAGKRLARFTYALAVQSDVAQPDVEAAGPVAELSPGKWIVSTRKSGGAYGLAFWSQEGGRAVAIENPEAANAVQPAAIRPRVAPKEFPSALVASRRTGNLLCLNARDGKPPIGPGAQAVQVYGQDAAGAPVLLGRQTVAGDGSFYVEVPADRPLRIALVDEAGRTIRAEQGWFWMRPSEQRICVGCHLGPERSPENKVPDILLRSVVPEKMLAPIDGH